MIIIRLNRLDWRQEQIAEVVGISQGRVAQIINNTIFGKINNLLCSISQSLETLCLIRWLEAVLSLMYALFLSEDANPLILPLDFR